jgi:hypothetical protein
VNPHTGQHLGDTKFTSDLHKSAYTKIKALKTILKIDLNTYFLRKLLLRKVEYGDTSLRSNFLYKVMSLPELKEKFESRIDYDQWDFEDSHYIPLKKKREF